MNPTHAQKQSDPPWEQPSAPLPVGARSFYTKVQTQTLCSSSTLPQSTLCDVSGLGASLTSKGGGERPGAPVVSWGSTCLEAAALRTAAESRRSCCLWLHVRAELCLFRLLLPAPSPAPSPVSGSCCLLVLSWATPPPPSPLGPLLRVSLKRSSSVCWSCKTVEEV